MSPEAQRIAIAEACGWQHCEINHYSTGMFHKGAAIGTSPDSKRTRYIPSYTTDLNAMHKAEKALTDEQDLEYSESLEQVVGARFNSNNGEDMRRLRSATGAQRAEAFLKTIGKWKE